MLSKSSNVQKWPLRIGFPVSLSSKPILILALIACVPSVHAQVSSLQPTEGEISGTVLSDASNQPATQVVVSLKSHAAGIFRSVLTDFAGHFEVRSLPPGQYDINIEEAGFEPAKTSAQLDNQPVKLILRLKPTESPSSPGRYIVSVRELKISGKARDEYKKGLLSLQKKDWSGSLEHFGKAVKAFPQYYEAYYHEGLIETNLGHFEEAMQAFQKSMDLSGGRYALAPFRDWLCALLAG
jgi:Carboxypeptidase regulatory-like domain